MLVRREVFEELGGFDEAFPVAFNDLDFCLRLGRAGYRTLYTPHAELIHHESVSRGLSGLHRRLPAVPRAMGGPSARRTPTTIATSAASALVWIPVAGRGRALAPHDRRAEPGLVDLRPGRRRCGVGGVGAIRLGIGSLVDPLTTRCGSTGPARGSWFRYSCPTPRWPNIRPWGPPSPGGGVQGVRSLPPGRPRGARDLALTSSAGPAGQDDPVGRAGETPRVSRAPR